MSGMTLSVSLKTCCCCLQKRAIHSVALRRAEGEAINLHS